MSAQSRGSGPFTEPRSRLPSNAKSHPLDTLSNAQESDFGHFQDVESGEDGVITALPQQPEHACDRSDGASDRELVSTSLAC
jgi:hypothetical protein